MRDIETFALKELEYLRIATRVAPMLGLVATMIPMGPALKALANGNVQGISENLIVAFTAVIFGLITASITFWIASIKKHWLVVEMGLVEDMISERDRIAPIEQRARCESSLTAPYDPVELPPRPEESYEAA
jgi:biopolymer transport protein ExbB/TolQ